MCVSVWEHMTYFWEHRNNSSGSTRGEEFHNHLSDVASQGALIVPWVYLFCWTVGLLRSCAAFAPSSCRIRLTSRRFLAWWLWVYRFVARIASACFVLSRDRLGVENDIPLVCVVLGIQWRFSWNVEIFVLSNGEISFHSHGSITSNDIERK
jgi:hypothetical protein